MAAQLYPGGILIEEDHLHHEEAVQKTLKAMENSNLPAVYEAAFTYDDVRVRVDILERGIDGRWNLVEVKSSTSVKEVHVPDVAIQSYVLKGSGLVIGKTGILHVNNGYVFDGEKLELESLFQFHDLTEQTMAMAEETFFRVAGMKRILEKTSPPEILPSRFCKSPYACEFWEYCTRGMPEDWVMTLTGITQKRMDELAALGIHDIRQIPDSFSLTALQERIRSCVTSGKIYMSPDVRTELGEVTFPIHFLDFETVSPGIPRYSGTRPYQTIPFQWSDHRLFDNGTLEHEEYLCEEAEDPREGFASTLLEALGSEGTIFVYASYEIRIIHELAEHLPRHRERLLGTLDRFKDLQAVIKNHLYHPGFHGSFSLKAVLPALVPDMSYEKLALQEGGHASMAYLRMIDPATPPDEKERIKRDLLAYCGYDTLAMVKIREELLRRAA